MTDESAAREFPVTPPTIDRIAANDMVVSDAMLDREMLLPIFLSAGALIVVRAAIVDRPKLPLTYSSAGILSVVSEAKLNGLNALNTYLRLAKDSDVRLAIPLGWTMFLTSSSRG